MLIAATIASPSMAQTAKKAMAPGAKAEKAVAMKAQAAPAKANKKTTFNVAEKRSFTARSSSVFATEKKAGKLHRSVSLNAPAKEAANMPQINGIVVYNDVMAEEDAGLYEIPQNGNSSAQPIVTGFTADAACVEDGLLYAFGTTKFWGYIMSIDLYEIDVQSQEILQQYDFEAYSMVLSAVAKDPTTGIIYSIGYDDAGETQQFGTVTLNGASTYVTKICEVDRNWNTIAFDKNGQLWGISYTGTSASGSYEVTSSSLCKIDKTTGSVTVIGETGQAPQYLSSGCIDPVSGRFFWNVCPADEMGYIFEVDLTTGAATQLYTLKDNDEIMGMYVPAPEAEEGAPAACENVEVSFSGASLTGNVSLTAPSTLFNGSAGIGNVTVHVVVDGEDNTVTTVYGEEVTVPVTLTEAGLYTFAVYASNSAGDGPKVNVKNIWVGADTPEATEATLAYANGTMTVSWDAVTATVNGGYMDVDNVTYTVKDMEGTVKASGLTATTWSEEIVEPEAITKYQYQVLAVCDGLTSAPALTNSITLGSVVPPYTSNFAEDGIQGWTLIDGNEDGKVWDVVNNSLRMVYNSSKAMDDWAITMPIKLEAGLAYNFSVKTWANSTSFPERLEIKYGTAPTVAGMTETILEPTDITGTSGNGELEVEKMIVPEETGVYYIGFHGISDADQFYLFIGNFTIDAGVSSDAPGLGEIEVVADASGALSTTLNVTYPSKTMSGATLSSITKAEIYRGETLIKTIENPAVGGTDQITDNVESNGDYKYSLVCYNSIGRGLVAESASVFVGFGAPAGIESATIARTSTVGEVVVTWTPVTTDIYGKTYPAGAVKYIVCTDGSYGWEPITEEMEGTSYTYQAVEAGEQDFVQLAIFPYYEEEEGNGAATDMIPVGTPYQGLAESFPNAKLGDYIWGLRAIGSSGTVELVDDTSGIPSQDGDNGFIGIYAKYLDQGADFFSGLISLDGMENPGLTFYTFDIATAADGGNPDINEITVSVKTSDEEEFTVVQGPMTVQDICEGSADGWGKVTVSLADYAGKVIQFQITGIVKAYLYTMIDNIKVGNILAHDLKAASISAPAKVKVGNPYSVDVVVSNEGAQNVASYSVELYADDELAATEACSDLAFGASNTVTFAREMSPVAQESVTYYAKVVYADDEAPEDNTTETIVVAPIVSTLPAPEDLDGSSVENGIKLTWSEPNIDSPANAAPAPVTEDFEDADAFTAEYGSWTFVDLDESEVGGFSGTDIPGITPGGTKGSFWIWDTDVESGAPYENSFKAHSGTHYLFALFRYDDGQTDDWAISPALYGGAQTISFYAKSYSTSYPEKIKVSYSTLDSTNPEDYTDVLLTVNAVPGDWTLYEVELPAGAMHFAINSCAEGSFMLMVDDVTYIPGDGSGAKLELKGYNVYRDGVKINDALVEETEFVDTNVVEGQQYTYIVTAVYENLGESALSNEAVVTYEPTGIADVADGKVAVVVENNNLVVLNAAEKNVVISSANGAVVYSGVGEARTVVPVGKGVYVVKVDKTVKKVIVK